HKPIGEESVEVLTIDQWISEEHIDPSLVSILKLDVQGAELLALRGAEKVLAHARLVIAEVWNTPCYEGTPTQPEIEEFLAERGFDLLAVFDHPSGIWGDAVYVQREKRQQVVRLNIGAGDTV